MVMVSALPPPPQLIISINNMGATSPVIDKFKPKVKHPPVRVKYFIFSFLGGDWILLHPEFSIICLIVPPPGPTSRPTYLEQHQIRASLKSGGKISNLKDNF